MLILLSVSLSFPITGFYLFSYHHLRMDKNRQTGRESFYEKVYFDLKSRSAIPLTACPSLRPW